MLDGSHRSSLATRAYFTMMRVFAFVEIAAHADVDAFDLDHIGGGGGERDFK